MIKTDTKTKIRLLSLIFALTLFAVWVLFYFIISAYIQENTGRQMEQAARQIIERLGMELSQVERLARSLRQNADINALMREQDSYNFFTLAGKAVSLIDEEIYNLEFIDSIILFGSGNNFYRLSGRLGNRSCMRLLNAVNNLNTPCHLSIELDNKRFIGYADSLNDTKHGGAIVILTEEEKILGMLRSYDQSGSLLVTITAGNEVIAANTNKTYLFAPDTHNRQVVQSRLGITPYRISITSDEGYMRDSFLYFSFAALITAVIFGIVLSAYTRILNRSFFNPMVNVIGSIKTLNTDAQKENLPHVQSEEFDSLIDKINEMLLNIKTKNMEVKAAQLRAMNAEIEKQKAIIFSLKKQINAHFFINTLNIVKLLAEQGELEKAQAVVMGLTSLIRYVYDREDFINIWEELGTLENYIMIMNSWYDGKLNVDFDFDDLLMEYYIPRMIFQPIIENSIIHGFKEMNAGCFISVKAQISVNCVIITVNDNGRGLSGEEIMSLNEKLKSSPEDLQGFENIALLNIKNRLYFYFSDSGRLTIKMSDSGGLEVSVLMPLIAEKATYVEEK